MKTMLLVFMLNVINSNPFQDKLISTIVNEANDTCFKYYNTKLFESNHSKFTQCKTGMLIQGYARQINTDSLYLFTFKAIKVVDWVDWKIRVRKSSKRVYTKQEIDYLANWTDSIDLIAMDTTERKNTTQLLIDKINRINVDTILLNEYNYWKMK